MTRPDPHPDALRLYLTGEHPCSYLPGQRARTLFVDPLTRIDGARAQLLQQTGFRRSGAHFYRPACHNCKQCVSVRVPVAAFRANRTQRRIAKRNRDLRINLRVARFSEEHYRLYARYLRARHADGDMIDDLSRESYRVFLLAPWGGETYLLEFCHEERLLAVAVCDLLEDGLSAVYTFFDPEQNARSLGTFAILTQIAVARRFGLHDLYLGYWIAGCRKMAYKAGFRPLEAWDGRAWRVFDHQQPQAQSCAPVPAPA